MKKIMWSALALLLVGCAGDNNGGEEYRYNPPIAKATNNTQEMAIPVDLVWARAEKWFTDHGLTIENSQRGSGLMTANVNQSADGLEWLVEGTTIRVVPVRRDPVAAFRGQGKGGAVKRLLAERKADRARE